MSIPNDTRFTDLLQRADQLGQAEGQGKKSRAELAIEICIGAAQGIIGAGRKDKEVDAVYTAFLKGNASARGSDQDQQASFKVQVSKLKQFAVLGNRFVGHQDDGDTAALYMADAREVSNDTPEAKGSTFDRMLSIARAQIADETHLFDRDEMQAALMPEEKEEATPIERLGKLIKAAEKLQKGTEGNDMHPPKPGLNLPDLDRALEYMNQGYNVLKMAEAKAALSASSTLIKGKRK
jgi:hypothetical protein